MKLLKRMRAKQWAWLHFKIALGGFWSTAMFFVTPTVLKEGLPTTSILLWTIGTMIGMVISVVGMFMSMTRSRRLQLIGLTIEFVGLMLFMGGPIQYFSIQASQLGINFQDRFALACFAYAMVAAVLVRVIEVVSILLKNAATHLEDDE